MDQINTVRANIYTLNIMQGKIENAKAHAHAVPTSRLRAEFGEFSHR